MRLSRIKLTERERALKQAYDTLVSQSRSPITASDLANALQLPHALVYSILRNASWWTEEMAAASRRESYRRYQEQLSVHGAHGMEKARAARQPGSVRRKLTRQKVLEIQSRLSQRETITTLADQFNVHRNTIWQIKNGESWTNPNPRKATSAILVQIQVSDSSQTRGCLGLDQTLWERLGKPTHVQIGRGHGAALVLEPAFGGLLVTNLGSSEQLMILLERTLCLQLGLPAGNFMSLASLTVNGRLHLSDFPAEEQTEMITLPEASHRQQCTRQWIEYLIAQEKIHVYYDAERRQKVLRSTDV